MSELKDSQQVSRLCGASGHDVPGKIKMARQSICIHCGVKEQNEMTHWLFPDGKKIYEDDSRFKDILEDRFQLNKMPHLCERGTIYFACRKGHRLGNDGLGLAVVRFDPNTHDIANYACKDFEPTERWRRIYETGHPVIYLK